ncbi:16S rRNA (guanine(527)-N(7))-methyltransferase RsmG [Beijerinckia sp. L45]|uniref:16S rRNA (guanine(527)-N(7))-methyltransferase RsmG n=1 Tax=Beijerinckia sp. L45 TaxID=1641855 RepID=UPI00131AB5BD|nr:16S rRNA (guanine(527)-N(7))-methyltransferase RsmG [Beijerinckia sp. L45]
MPPNPAASLLATLTEDVGRRLRLYVELLHRWQPTINLIAPSTLPDVWSRHIADSLQVQAAVPAARRWLDLGSGGGFPGLVTAITLADEAGAVVHLVESDKRKAAFLRTVSRETGTPAIIHAERIEAFTADFDEPIDAISARALAPLPALVAYAEKYLLKGAIGVFPKGQQVDAELTAFDHDRRFHIETVPSQTQETARLLIVKARRLEV